MPYEFGDSTGLSGIESGWNTHDSSERGKAIEEPVVNNLQCDQQNYARHGYARQSQQLEPQREAQAGHPSGDSSERKTKEENIDSMACRSQAQSNLSCLPFRVVMPPTLEKEPYRVNPRRDDRSKQHSLCCNASCSPIIERCPYRSQNRSHNATESYPNLLTPTDLGAKDILLGRRGNHGDALHPPRERMPEFVKVDADNRGSGEH